MLVEVQRLDAHLSAIESELNDFWKMHILSTIFTFYELLEDSSVVLG